jgi:hypothetical protein
VEDASSAAEQSAFREGGWKAALKAGHAQVWQAEAGWFDRGRYRTVAGWSPFPGTIRHQLATRGVRAKSGWGRANTRAVAWVVVVECRSYTTPRLSQLGWRCFARGAVTRRMAACCRMWRFGVLASVLEDRFSCRIS